MHEELTFCVLCRLQYFGYGKFRVVTMGSWNFIHCDVEHWVNRILQGKEDKVNTV